MLTDNYAEVNGVRLHYVTAGSGDLILFLHGFPEFWYAWRRQVEAFAAEHQAVALDMRGYNLSDKPEDEGAYRIDHLVEDVRAFVGALGHTSCTLVGHDWGGVVAWAVAMAHPEIVARLVIVNAPHPATFARELTENPAQQKASEYMHFFRSADAEPAMLANDCQWLVDAVLQPKEAFTDADVAAYRAAWTQPGALTGGLNYYRAAKIGPPRNALETGGLKLFGAMAARQVPMPTLVVWGEADPFILASNLDGLDALVPDLRIERIPNGTHWVIHEQPERINARIGIFLARGE
jgi:pimeloyl-ACP methyl ester carboxylesterase